MPSIERAYSKDMLPIVAANTQYKLDKHKLVQTQLGKAISAELGLNPASGGAMISTMRRQTACLSAVQFPVMAKHLKASVKWMLTDHGHPLPTIQKQLGPGNRNKKRRTSADKPERATAVSRTGKTGFRKLNDWPSKRQSQPYAKIFSDNFRAYFKGYDLTMNAFCLDTFGDQPGKPGTGRYGQTLNKIVYKGLDRLPKYETVVLLAKAMGYTPWELIGQPEGTPPDPLIPVEDGERIPAIADSKRPSTPEDFTPVNGNGHASSPQHSFEFGTSLKETPAPHAAVEMLPNEPGKAVLRVEWVTTPDKAAGMLMALHQTALEQ